MKQRTFSCFAIFLFWINSAFSLEENLIDTRTATSDIGWVMPQGSEWQEASSPYEDGTERRTLMVCRMQKVKQNNWVRSPYIPVNGASRIYVEFEFTMRSCEDVPNVATCKETFNFFYYEADRDEATSTFPPWNEGEYTKVDTIAADKRFRRGSSETNLETRDIGPISKKGIYLALQDTGACMALMHVRVYYKYCSSVIQNLAEFPQTIAGSERTSLVEVPGRCVEHSTKNKAISASLHCNSEGVWAVPQGRCVCDSGFTPNLEETVCQACGQGLFKPLAGNNACQRCPAYSHSRNYASTLCECMFGYFRATSDEPTSPCTKPPGKVLDLHETTNRSGTTLMWKPPPNDGGRDDLYYRVECERCQPGFSSCRPCSNLYYNPAGRELQATKVKVQGLSAFTHYRFKVFAENGVSAAANNYGLRSEYASVTMVTKRTKPPTITTLQAVSVDTNSFGLVWVDPSSDPNWEYEIVISNYYTDQPLIFNITGKNSMKIHGLRENRDYFVEIRAKNEMGYGPFSEPLQVKTKGKSLTVMPPTDAPPVGQDDNIIILVAVIVGVLLVVFVIAGICIWHRRHEKSEKKIDLDLEKHPMFNTSTFLSTSYAHPHKTYIDPSTYDDPHRALLQFAKELDVACVKIESVIGGGEFGEVCRGAVLFPGGDKPHDVAIKTLKSGYSPQQKMDFLGEASIMGQFDHPNVICLEGVVTKSRPLMIITEYMENGSLDSFLRNHDNEFTVMQLVGMLRNISEGMKYLSKMGYIHRDLAARNILVNSQLVCKVSDFGMSRVLENEDDATYMTRGGKIPIRWTAPEAITFRNFSSACDVWSYGIVMWEVMSYGERPYWGMSNQDVIQAVGSGYRLPAPMECPLVLHHLMLSCWKKDTHQRPKFADIVTILDRISRDPSQLKLTAGVNSNNNGRLVPVGEGLLATPSDEQKLLSNSNSSISDISSQIFSQNSSELLILSNWLNSIGLGSYKDVFVQCGCYTIEQVCRLKTNDLCRLGMTSPDDQNTLLDNIYAIRCEKSNSLQQKVNNLEGVPV